MPITRLESQDKVSGQALFAGDLKLDGLLQGKILRSNVPHARIKNIDTSQAAELPGVLAVITGQDFPDGKIGFNIFDEVAMPKDKIRYFGEPVAAVAAVDQKTAERALELIRLDIEELPGVFSAADGLTEDAPLIHEDLMNYGTMGPVRRYGNVATHVTVKKGNIAEGFAESDVIIEDTFSLPLVHQAPLEPKSVVARYEKNGNLTVWCSTQAAFGVRQDLAGLLGLPISRIRVVGVRIGGGFGGKTRATVEAIAALLAIKAHQPVKIEMSREDDFFGANPRHPMQIWVKTGTKSDGTLVAKQAKILLGTGAYANFGPIATSWACTLITGPYEIPNLQIEGICVYTNTISSGACRAPSGPQTHFATETQMDRIARELKMSPFTLRAKNALRKGKDTATGQILTDDGIGYENILNRLEKEVKEHLPIIPERPGMLRGIGIAGSFWGMSGMGSSALLRMNEDGTAVLNIGSVDIGTGADTAMAIIVSNELGISLDKIRVVSGDTDSGPQDFGAVGSRTTRSMGDAVSQAARQIKNRLLAFAAQQLNVPVDALSMGGGRVFIQNDPSTGIGFHDMIIPLTLFLGGPLIAAGSFAAPPSPFDPARVNGHVSPTEPFYVFGAQAVAVDVDPSTGRVEVLTTIAVHDVGKAVFMPGVEGQIQGGVAMGLGYALYEEAILQDGKILNPNFLDYRVPTLLDISTIKPIVLEKPDAAIPDDIRGVGEPPIIPTAAAVANAVFDATGVRQRALPMTPERVYNSMKAKRSS